MLNKIYLLGSVAIAAWAINSAVRYPSAFTLRQENQENQSNYTSRRGSRMSGVYIGGYWQASPSRTEYPEFRGGGLGTGK